MMRIIICFIFVLTLNSCNFIKIVEGGKTKVPNEFLENKSSNMALTVSNLTASNASEDTELIITLSYSDTAGDQADACSISNIINITETTPCACSAGVCSVGVTGTLNFNGSASFSYTVSANSKNSNSANVNFTINNASISCPTGFIPVDGNGVLGTFDFCVMKYEARNDGSENAISQGTGFPWTSIAADDGIASSNSDAFEKCSNMVESGFFGTFALISNAEWMTIARDIENVASNWSGGSVGSGVIPRGHTDNSPAFVIQITDSTAPYNETGNNSGDSIGAGWEQKRTHLLSNGSEIWDLSGNAGEWVDWDSSDAAFTVGPTDETNAWQELSVNPVGSLLLDEYKPSGAYTSSQYIGQWVGAPNTGTGGAVIRGGRPSFAIESGIFSLSLYNLPSLTSANFGFRCTYHP